MGIGRMMRVGFVSSPARLLPDAIGRARGGAPPWLLPFAARCAARSAARLTRSSLVEAPVKPGGGAFRDLPPTMARGAPVDG